ncbi:TetR/AcrR family transcriptional regulator [Saccharopolyspora indica]|uniref:TetR/AcrR family transcriptional regulator n=1 Tax=Saccharopolyspora indica TaxID=1229659 RepID=UPI0022EB35BB|nr:TetR/AcrR family transcriptional regulator [Saccharopolyspora indica]MDA3644261.1 helix-turn-helix domain containing protein [Saccharopolyspora indica]
MSAPRAGAGSRSSDAGQQRETRAMRKRAGRIRLIEHTAARLFAERGYEATNFEDIGAALDMRGSSLYYYFPSKEELFLRCMENSAAEVFPRLRAIAGSGGAPLRRLRSMFREEAVITLREYPEFVPLFLKVQVPIEALEQRRNELRREQTLIFRDVVDELAESQVPRVASLHSALNLALGGLALIGEWFNPERDLGVEEFADQVSCSLIRLFGAEPE